MQLEDSVREKGGAKLNAYISNLRLFAGIMNSCVKMRSLR
jgi:hypothetical protein